MEAVDIFQGLATMSAIFCACLLPVFFRDFVKDKAMDGLSFLAAMWFLRFLTSGIFCLVIWIILIMVSHA